VVDRIEGLVAEGFSRMAIADAAGISRRNLVQGLFVGRKRLRKSTADALMGLTRADIIRKTAPVALIPCVGASRRLQALMRMGWRMQDIAETRADYYRINSIRTQRHGRVTAESHLYVADLYDKYSMREGPSKTNRTKAAKYGYAPPLAWDDIDDPNATPQTGHDPSRAKWREGFTTASAAFIARVETLIDQGYTVPQVCAETGCTIQAIRLRFRRHAPDHPLRPLLAQPITDRRKTA